jgi:hypothetical protein
VRGASTTLRFEFTVPAALGGLRIEPSARVPATSWRSPEERWTDREVHDVEW